MATFDLISSSLIAEFGTSDLSIQRAQMDEDDLDALDSPSEEISSLTPDQSYEKQTSNLNAYLRTLPYECESVEEMQKKLEYIISKLVICAASKNWSVLTTWDAMLQWYAPFSVLGRHVLTPS
jgi:proteasome activator subunit 4